MRKKVFLILFTTFIISKLFAQNFSELANYEFESSESYKPSENQVLICANYLFDNPADQAELNRLYSTQYIIKWMTGTPDYTFDIGEDAMELTKGNSDLLGLYMAAMSKVVIENEGENLIDNEIYNQAETLLVKYCSDPNNKMKPSKKIKKIIKSSKE